LNVSGIFFFGRRKYTYLGQFRSGRKAENAKKILCCDVQVWLTGNVKPSADLDKLTLGENAEGV